MPLASNESICGVCINQRLSYDLSFSPFLYKGGISKLMNHLKHQQDICAISSLATIFSDAYLHSVRIKPDLIIPIPLSQKRYFQRGFNQSNEISKIVSRRLGIKNEHQILSRIKDTAPQQGLKRKDRLKNLDGCFQIKPLSSNFLKRELKGKIVALLDDVVTTGATMECAAKVLKQYGVKKIYAWSVARTDL